MPHSVFDTGNRLSQGTWLQGVVDWPDLSLVLAEAKAFVEARKVGPNGQ